MQGQIIDCNRAAETLFGHDRGATRGIRFADLVTVDGFDDPLSMLHSFMRKEDTSAELKDGRIQMIAHHAGGMDVPVEVALAEAKGAGGEPMFIAFIRDISERIEREESLQRARNDALKGEEAKSRFLAVMSHEMRTPLNGLIAATELMQSSTDLDQRQTWLSEIALSCGWAALDQVNNVLELTRLGSDQSDNYQVVDFSPVQVIRELMLQNQPHAGKRGNDLVFAEPETPVPFVSAPRQLFLRVLYNLLGNAIKFTDAGRVTVQLHTTPSPDGQHLTIAVSVIDTGIGIAEQDLVRIFHNFETLDASYARYARRHGPWPRHCQTLGRGDGRPDHRAIPIGQGQHLHLHRHAAGGQNRRQTRHQPARPGCRHHARAQYPCGRRQPDQQPALGRNAAPARPSGDHHG